MSEQTLFILTIIASIILCILYTEIRISNLKLDMAREKNSLLNLMSSITDTIGGMISYIEAIKQYVKKTRSSK